MQNETSQQRADRMLHLDQERRASYTPWDSDPIATAPKAHDIYCRCRACKPPYPAEGSWVVPVSILACVLFFIGIAVAAIILRMY